MDTKKILNTSATVTVESPKGPTVTETLPVEHNKAGLHEDKPPRLNERNKKNIEVMPGPPTALSKFD